jgi:hypothetical protein
MDAGPVGRHRPHRAILAAAAVAAGTFAAGALAATVFLRSAPAAPGKERLKLTPVRLDHARVLPRAPLRLPKRAALRPPAWRPEGVPPNVARTRFGWIVRVGYRSAEPTAGRVAGTRGARVVRAWPFRTDARDVTVQLPIPASVGPGPIDVAVTFDKPQRVVLHWHLRLRGAPAGSLAARQIGVHVGRRLIVLAFETNHAVPGRIEVTRDGHSLGSQPYPVAAGLNLLRLPVSTGGNYRVRVTLLPRRGREQALAWTLGVPS